MRSWRELVCSLALGLILSAPLSPATAREASKEYPECIKSCDTSRTECDARCEIDCEAMFPTDLDQRKACLNSCHSICVEIQQDCKLRCRAGKPGGSPPNP